MTANDRSPLLQLENGGKQRRKRRRKKRLISPPQAARPPDATFIPSPVTQTSWAATPTTSASADTPTAAKEIVDDRAAGACCPCGRALLLDEAPAAAPEAVEVEPLGGAKEGEEEEVELEAPSELARRLGEAAKNWRVLSMLSIAMGTDHSGISEVCSRAMEPS
jgi:hypothetical protein